MTRFRGPGVYKLKIVPSGYDFLGPGNEVTYHVPRNYNDVIAKAHDIAYGKLQEKGLNPYITFNQADQDFIDGIRPDDVASTFAEYAFRGKKFLAQLGFLPIEGTSFPYLLWATHKSTESGTGSRTYHLGYYILSETKKHSKTGSLDEDKTSQNLMTYGIAQVETNIWMKVGEESERPATQVYQIYRTSLQILPARAQAPHTKEGKDNREDLEDQSWKTHQWTEAQKRHSHAQEVQDQEV